MKRYLSFGLLLCMGVLMAGCSSNYAIHTNDGRTIISDGTPSVGDSGLISYKDANGVTRQINQSDVTDMVKIE
ncbi:lipoprotein [Salmonella enterica subsp. enterica serovar Choleraesuis]|nr:lipoprotein [Salmonella enterica subsp. enterica serovar Choleraesuis]